MHMEFIVSFTMKSAGGTHQTCVLEARIDYIKELLSSVCTSSCQFGTSNSTCNKSFCEKISLCRSPDLKKLSLTMEASSYLIIGEGLRKTKIKEKEFAANCSEQTSRSMIMCGANPIGGEERDEILANFNNVEALCLSLVPIEFQAKLSKVQRSCDLPIESFTYYRG